MTLLVDLLIPTERQEQQDCSNGGHNKFAQQARGYEPDQAKNKTSNDGANHANDQIADDSKAASLGELPRKPTGGQPYENKVKEI